jgi:OOP family OmpA-OmpF porin
MKKIFAAAFILAFALAAGAQKPEPTKTEALLTVIVENEKHVRQEGERVTIIQPSTGKEFTGVTGAGGTFDILIPKGETYKVKYRNFGADMEYATLPIPTAKDTLLSFEFTIIYSMPKVYTLRNTYFDTGKSTIRPESYKELNNLAEFMQLKKTMVIEIGGHTDNVGTPESNRALSENRAKSVKEYLVKKGISPGRIQAKGYGDTQPVASNASEEGRQKNRRTEVKVIKE